jgi:glycosyltransferase involved in cell wall biosynthesis
MVPVVSVVMIFLNEEKYLAEAVESVLSQTFTGWELLLVDDGSIDASSELARAYAAQRPQQIYYLEHPGHANRGMSASRNLGIRQATGPYIALMDADDVWLRNKLTEQVALLETHTEAGMLYGQSLHWYSWTKDPKDRQRDFLPGSGLLPHALIQPPQFLPLFLRGKTNVPCPSSILVRRAVIEATGGFEDTFVGPYEDQVFYSKVSLLTPILVCNNCWNRYRRHPEASAIVWQKSGQAINHRQFFIDWLQTFLQQRGVTDAVIWQAVRREIWRIHQPAWLPTVAPFPYLNRWIKKWLLRIEERALPSFISDRLWQG